MLVSLMTLGLIPCPATSLIPQITLYLSMKYQLIIFLMIAALRCAAQDTTKETIYTRVEIESAFPFGQSAWSRFLDKNLHYPWKARDKSIQGTVVVEFIVDKEGNTSYIHAISGPEELRQEAERLIKVSRKWTPAIQDGRQVWSHKRMPIEFKLDN
jgi:protein TonB